MMVFVFVLLVVLSLLRVVVVTVCSVAVAVLVASAVGAVCCVVEADVIFVPNSFRLLFLFFGLLFNRRHCRIPFRTVQTFKLWPMFQSLHGHTIVLRLSPFPFKPQYNVFSSAASLLFGNSPSVWKTVFLKFITGDGNPQGRLKFGVILLRVEKLPCSCWRWGFFSPTTHARFRLPGTGTCHVICQKRVRFFANNAYFRFRSWRILIFLWLGMETHRGVSSSRVFCAWRDGSRGSFGQRGTRTW